MDNGTLAGLLFLDGKETSPAQAGTVTTGTVTTGTVETGTVETGTVETGTEDGTLLV